MHHLHTVFNTVNDSPRSTLHLILACTAFVLVVSFCVAMYLGRGRKAVITLNTGHKVNPFLMALLPATLVFAIYAKIDIMDINVYQHDKALLNSNSSEVKVVEGNVKNYYAEARDGHGNEEFTVQDTLFHYSHFEDGRSGYHATYWYGGVIRQNLYVRITYYYDGDRNAILKLETE